MRIQIKDVLFFVLLLGLILSPATATVCSFINITQGVPGVDNMTMNMTMNQTINQTMNQTILDLSWNTSYCLLSGASAMTGNLSLGGFNISYILDPVAPQDAATRNYIDTFPIINSSYLTVAINNSYDTIDNRTANIINSSYLTVAINNSYVTLDNTTYSGQFATTANLSSTNVSGQANLTAYITAVNASVSGNYTAYDIAQNTSIKSYIDTYTVALTNTSYVQVTNGTYILTNNNTYVLTNNATYVLTGGSRAFTASQSMGNFYLTNVDTGTTGGNAANKTYADTMKGYTLYITHASSSPADSVKNYWGMWPAVLNTTAATQTLTIPKSGTIKRILVNQYSGTASTAEAYSLYVYKNNVVDNSTGFVATQSNSKNFKTFANISMSKAVSAGDYIEMVYVNPAWVTNPLTTVSNGYVYIE